MGRTSPRPYFTRTHRQDGELKRYFGQIVVLNSRIPAAMGEFANGRPFAAWTMFNLSFFPQKVVEAVDPKVIRHEYEHVRHFAFFWAASWILWLLIRPPFWVFLTGPFTYSIVYGLTCLVLMIRGKHPYRDNPFERAADHAAGEA